MDDGKIWRHGTNTYGKTTKKTPNTVVGCVRMRTDQALIRLGLGFHLEDVEALEYAFGSFVIGIHDLFQVNVLRYSHKRLLLVLF